MFFFTQNRVSQPTGRGRFCTDRRFFFIKYKKIVTKNFGTKKIMNLAPKYVFRKKL